MTNQFCEACGHYHEPSAYYPRRREQSEIYVAMGELGLVHVYIGRPFTPCVHDGLEVETRILPIATKYMSVTLVHGHKRHTPVDCIGAWAHNPYLLDNPLPLPCKDAHCNIVWEALQRYQYNYWP